nr:LOW QUALITY PROTEIN: RNA-binding protein with serine-rich domain 1-like [Globicephala melas]
MTLLISGRANSRRQMLCTPTTFSQPSPHRAASGRGLLWDARIDCSTPRATEYCNFTMQRIQNAGFSTGSRCGCSSSSASSRSGSSSSSPGSPSPSRRRHDSRRRSRSKSKPPKRDEKERKRRSPSPKPAKVHVGRLTRNVTEDHMEILSTYGKIKMIDVPVERMHPHLSTGYAYAECENPDEAEKALRHADGGHIDGQQITATAVLAPWPRPPPRRFSPPRRRVPPPPPMWRRPPPTPQRRRRSRPPRRRSPGRRSPRSCSSFNSSRCAEPPKLCPVTCIPANSLLSLFSTKEDR